LKWSKNFSRKVVRILVWLFDDHVEDAAEIYFEQYYDEINERLLSFEHSPKAITCP
jgi:hypothetical protein